MLFIFTDLIFPTSSPSEFTSSPLTSTFHVLSRSPQTLNSSSGICGYRCLLMHYVITLNNPSSSSYIQCHSFQRFSPFLEVIFPVTIFNIPVNMLLRYLLCLPIVHVSFPQWKEGGPAFETKEPLLCFLSLIGYFFLCIYSASCDFKSTHLLGYSFGYSPP